MDLLNTRIHCLNVHVDYFFSLTSVGGLNGLLHVVYSISLGENFGELKESCLQHRVGAVAKAYFTRDLNCVNNIDMNTVISNILLCCGRQMLRKLLGIISTVNQKCAAGLNILSHVVL